MVARRPICEHVHTVEKAPQRPPGLKTVSQESGEDLQMKEMDQIQAHEIQSQRRDVH